LFLDLPGSFARLHAARNFSRRLNKRLSFSCGAIKVNAPERRQLTRYNLRTPLRFRALGVAADTSEHFTEALNVSRGGFFFASSAPLQIGMPLEATLRMPKEVTGDAAQETNCTARIVHARSEPFGDGRIGFGAEIEKLNTPGSGRGSWVG
jgi:hypothetical protein